MRIVSINHELLYKSDRLTIEIDYKDRMALQAKLEALGTINPDAEYDIAIEKKRRRRSLDANAYMWVLADKIAEAVETTAKEVYRKAVREVGVWTDIAVRRQDLNSFIKQWTGQGIGYQVDVFDSGLADNKGQTMKRVRAYLGSHKYDSKQMSRLLDYIVEEAKGLNIETETPDELAKMKAAWEES